MQPPSTELERLLSVDAVSYYRAAERLVEDRRPFAIFLYAKPFNFLLGHCCELIIKSQLVASGVDPQEWLRRRVQHDLIALMEDAKLSNIAIDADFETYVRIMSAPHRDHHFRYAGKASPAFINPLDALTMVRNQLRDADMLGQLGAP